MIAPTLVDFLRISRCGQRAVAGVVRLADLAVGDLDRRRQVERRVRRDLAVLERAGHRERLERRARLVGGADRAVLARVLGRVAGLVGVDLRPVREREDLAVARVHHDRGRALGLVRLADLGEHLLGASWIAASSVSRTFWPGAVGRGVAQLDRVAERVLDQLALAVAAAQVLVVLVLEPGQALVVGAGEAEQLRGHPVARVDPLGLVDELEPLDAQLLDAVRARLGGMLARELDEAGVAARELLEQVVLAARRAAARACAATAAGP